MTVHVDTRQLDESGKGQGVPIGRVEGLEDPPSVDIPESLECVDKMRLGDQGDLGLW